MRFENHIGLDIGETTIKLVQLTKSGDKFNLKSIGILETPKIDGATEKDNAIRDLIKKLMSTTGASGKATVVGLPESQVYTRVIEMPYLEEPELSSAIRWQAEQYIPVALSDVVLKHQVLSLPQTGIPDARMKVLLVAAPNLLVSRYMEILGKAGLEILAIETEIFAVARALVAVDEFSPTTLLVNFGTEATTLAVLQRGDMSLTQSISSGGMAMTRALINELRLESTQAEEYKRSYGLDETKLEGKVAASLKPSVDQVLTEVKRVIAFYETRQGAVGIKRVVLSGGGALMPGLVQYFTLNLHLEVQLGNPFAIVNLSDKQRQAVFDAGPLFAAGVGLAMKMT